VKQIRMQDRKRIVTLVALLATACLGTPLHERIWLRLENGSFVVWSVAEPEETRAIAAELERFRTATATLLRLRPPAGARKPAVVILDDQGEITTFCGDGVAGCFHAGAAGPAIFMSADFSEAFVPQIVRHEYVHALYQHHPWSVPDWFEEGVAELLSTLEVEGDEFVLGRAPTRVAPSIKLLRARQVSWVPLAKALDEDYERIGGWERVDAYFQYWMLVRHWYVEDRDRDALNRYLESFHAGERSVPAFERAFGVGPDEYWHREVWPEIAEGTLRVKRLTLRGAAPDLAFDERPAPAAEVWDYLSSSRP
jgi:hypothetical protein